MTEPKKPTHPPSGPSPTGTRKTGEPVEQVRPRDTDAALETYEQPSRESSDPSVAEEAPDSPPAGSRECAEP
ncbi:MAG: hypothetical protein HXY30_20415 [Pseudorhodoplanes sp.]|nr:hypothetical protein [Pseudorhodoplanes sp.]